MMKRIFFLSVIILTIVSCNTQKVSVDYDRNFNFDTNKSYTFSKTDRVRLNDLDSARLFKSIEKGMLFKGFQKSAENNLVIHVVPEEYVSKKQTSNVGLGLGTGGIGFGGGVSVGIPITSQKLNQNYTVSMLNEGRLVWQGILKLEMPLNASPAVREARVDSGVMKLLKNFPPKAK
ncbi:protein of unknown function [Chishuiella changwenlii]|uniref:DUF4136 domain-containing protein n=1 Tax=Chishuiella changwenlii TaxID=1434701 RepID=A0A1M6WF71_9FLAO|nr:DUF4136 domain-containing protein [Chishuiella changwenlii]GGF05038.1 hypothetical protein GCM10010984_22860 [Chishuiella changwenlii]SHK92331.1 protein of unknown function [Chishuiella changwenlii]